MARSKAPAVRARLDVVEPGGRYVVNGVLVDANGRVLAEPAAESEPDAGSDASNADESNSSEDGNAPAE